MEKQIGSMGKEESAGRGEQSGSAKAHHGFSKDKTRMRGMFKRTKSLVIFALIFSVLAGLIQLALAEKYEVAVKVIGESGAGDFEAAGEGLDFGSLPQGDSSMRFVTIENNGNRDVRVRVFLWGAASRFVEVNRKDFTLGAGESENLEFTLKVPAGAEEKEYEGRIFVLRIPEIF